MFPPPQKDKFESFVSTTGTKSHLEVLELEWMNAWKNNKIVRNWEYTWSSCQIWISHKEQAANELNEKRHPSLQVK